MSSLVQLAMEGVCSAPSWQLASRPIRGRRWLISDPLAPVEVPHSAETPTSARGPCSTRQDGKLGGGAFGLTACVWFKCTVGLGHITDERADRTRPDRLDQTTGTRGAARVCVCVSATQESGSYDACKYVATSQPGWQVCRWMLPAITPCS